MENGNTLITKQMQAIQQCVIQLGTLRLSTTHRRAKVAGNDQLERVPIQYYDRPEEMSMIRVFSGTTSFHLEIILTVADGSGK